MTLFIQDYNSEYTLFQTEDFVSVPNEGEMIVVEGNWYKVVERVFFFKHLTNIDSNSCSLFVVSTDKN